MARNKFTLVGFKDEGLAWWLGKRLGQDPIILRDSSYPSGELNVHVPEKIGGRVLLATNITADPLSLFRTITATEGLRASGAKRVELIAPWIAYGRQDRAAQPGEAPAGLAVAKTLALFFDRITTFDAHSPTFIRAFRGKLMSLLPLTQNPEIVSGADVIAAPDHGAHARAALLAKRTKLPLIQLEKHRRPVGMSMRFVGRADVKGKRVVLIDDLIDTGSTLKLAARSLREAGAKDVQAWVTHAVRPTPDFVQAVFDHATGTIKPWALDYLAASIR